MARGLAVIETCIISETNEPQIQFCLILVPEVGDTFEIQKHFLLYTTNGTETTSQIANGVQAQASLEMGKLGITLAPNKVSVQ